ncbi:inositol polyphosphate kinase domain-containing protein [Ditylenchus destructor]|nr:inositol polyphosphate kinase domain-containing protein [Ditylenchus destructor]
MNQIETSAVKAIKNDRELDGITPVFYREVELDSKTEPGKKTVYMAMQDLLKGFQKEETHILDIKLAWRTFLEDIEIGDYKKQEDAFKKIGLDINEDFKKIFQEAGMGDKVPDELSNWDRQNLKDHLTSSRTLGFRISATKAPGEPPMTKRDYIRLKDEQEIHKKLDALLQHCVGERSAKDMLIERLEYMLPKIERSVFFDTHEAIASSILIVFDKTHLGAWLIDFGKTVELKGVKIDHKKQWVPGNHEDGYIAGFKNLIKLVKEGYAHNLPLNQRNGKENGSDIKKKMFSFCTLINKLHLAGNSHRAATAA